MGKEGQMSHGVIDGVDFGMKDLDIFVAKCFPVMRHSLTPGHSNLFFSINFIIITFDHYFQCDYFHYHLDQDHCRIKICISA